MKKNLKNTLSIFTDIFYKILSFLSFKGAVILMYHSVGDNDEFSTVKEKTFIMHMEYLNKHKYNIIALENLALLLKENKKIPRKTICITFDDGYEDNYSVVFEIMKKMNFPFTIFVGTAYIDSIFTTLRNIKIPFLKKHQIIEMANSGLVTIGSHSHNHHKLVHISKEQAIKELSESNNILESILNKKINCFSYPSGRFNEEVEILAKEKFSIICTVIKGRVKNGDLIYRLKRNSIDSKTSFNKFKGITKFGRIKYNLF